jgi:hypothetical protein
MTPIAEAFLPGPLSSVIRLREARERKPARAGRKSAPARSFRASFSRH